MYEELQNVMRAVAQLSRIGLSETRLWLRGLAARCQDNLVFQNPPFTLPRRD